MKILNIEKQDILYKVKTPVIYSPSLFSPELAENGSETTIGIVGSGLPTYKGFENLGDFDVVVDDTDSPYDKIGCTTAIAGFIGANGKHSLTGVAPFSKILSVKAFKDNGSGDPHDIVAAILWLAIKGVDVIVLPFKIDTESQLIYDAIKKAYENKIIILTIPFEKSNKIKEIISVDCFFNKEAFKITSSEGKASISLPKNKQVSAHGVEEFVKTSKTISSLGLVSGLVSCLVSRARNNKKTNLPKIIFEDLKKLSSS